MCVCMCARMYFLGEGALRWAPTSVDVSCGIASACETVQADVL